LRVAALYKGVRWVIWTLWISFVVFIGMRAISTILGSISFSGKLAYHQGLSRLTPSYVAAMAYSPIGGQCLAGSAGKNGGPVVGVFATLGATMLDLFLLTLTMVKALKSAASHPSSRIVCLALNFDLWLKPMLIPQAARTVEPRDSVRGTLGIMHLILICLDYRYFLIIVSQPQRF